MAARSIRNPEIAALTGTTHAQNFDSAAAALVADGVTVPSGTTHVWDVPSGAIFALPHRIRRHTHHFYGPRRQRGGRYGNARQRKSNSNGSRRQRDGGCHVSGGYPRVSPGLRLDLAQFVRRLPAWARILWWAGRPAMYFRKPHLRACSPAVLRSSCAGRISQPPTIKKRRKP